MSLVGQLTSEIKRLREEGYSLETIANAIRDGQYHIETARIAFEQAGFQAEIKRRKVLFVSFVVLVIMDVSRIEEVKRKSIIAIEKLVETGNNDAEMAELHKMVYSDKRDRTAVVDWTKHNN